MTYEGIARIVCTECGEDGGKKHHWGQVKAQKDGWFFQKDGKVWCPAHVPEWVAGWRARGSS